MNNTLGEKEFSSVGPTSEKLNFVTVPRVNWCYCIVKIDDTASTSDNHKSQVFIYLYTDIGSKAAFLVENIQKRFAQNSKFHKQKPAFSQQDGHGSNGVLTACLLKDKNNRYCRHFGGSCVGKLYADNIRLYSVLDNPLDYSDLQNNSNDLQQWSDRWQLSISYKKCIIL